MSVRALAAATCVFALGCSASTSTTVVAESKLPAVTVGEDGKPIVAAAGAPEGGLVMAAFPTTGEWATSKRSRHGASRGSQLAIPFSLTELSSVVIGEALDEKQARDATGGVEATELKIESQANADPYGYNYGSYGGYRNTYRTATLTGFSSGVLRMGGREIQVSEAGSTGPIYANCGQYEYKQSLRFEGMRRQPGGGFRYEVADGYWDGVQCKAFVTTRKAVDLAEIVEGKAFAFIQCSDEQCSKKTLNVVFPEVRSVVTQTGALRLQSGQPPTRVSMALRRGVAESVVATQAQSGWTQTNVTIEVQQGVNDDEPIAVAFVTDK